MNPSAAENEQRREAGEIIEHLPEGIAVVDESLHVIWANESFRDLDPEPIVGMHLASVLRCPFGLSADSDLFTAARQHSIGTARFCCGNDRWFDLRVTLIPSADGPVRYVIHLHDVTAEERRRQKLAALFHAGRALNNLDADQLADMSLDERTEVLKHNIRQIIHELLHYDVIELRLLDRATGRLTPVLEEGMTPEAAERVLYAREEGNGVTGFVAATGKSYLCRDATTDPHYLAGSTDAKSSLTVPLLFGDEVVGTFNVESPRPNTFTEQDLQFTETFAREIAQALHTLELLSAEKTTAAKESLEAVRREVAMPADDILSAASKLLTRTPPDDNETSDQLRRIVSAVRTIKQAIRNVGVSMVPPPVAPARDDGAAARLNGQRVLVVDGDERVRRTAHAMLEKYGCMVEGARTAAEAICMARGGTYDAFLIDIALPDANPYETFQAIRQLQPQATALMMTGFGYDASHCIVRARQGGLRAVLFKPFRPDQMIEALATPQNPGPTKAS